MKLFFAGYIALLFLCHPLFGRTDYPAGIVYGPKAAFNITAPTGWVVDNAAGIQQGLPCVLYSKGSSWADASTIMYAKIAGTQFENVDKFVATAIQEMGATHGLPRQKIESGQTHDGRAFFINEYPATGSYTQWERVAYVQLPKAVAYIVLSSRDEASYRRDASALSEVLKNFVYLNPRSEKKQ